VSVLHTDLGPADDIIARVQEFEPCSAPQAFASALPHFGGRYISFWRSCQAESCFSVSSMEIP